MADFYPLLTRAVSKLPVDSPHERQELYDQARAILLKQLRGNDGAVTAPSVVRQQASLEAAIRRIEAELRVSQLLVRRGPLSRGIDLAAETDFIGQRTNGRVVGEMISPTSSRLPIQNELIATLPRDTGSQFDTEIARYDEEKFVPGEKIANLINKRSRVDALGVYEGRSITTAYEDDTILPNERKEVRPTSKTGSMFDSSVSISRAIPKAEKPRQNQSRSAAHSIKTPTRPQVRLPLIIALVAGTAVIFILSAIIFLPVLSVNAGRYVWLSQHLFDNPAILRSTLIVSGLFLLVSFTLYHTGRKKLRRAFSRR